MLRLEAVTRRDFHPAIADASSAIGSCGGWVTNHQFYSNIMAMIAFEVPADQVSRLAEKLNEAEIMLPAPAHTPSTPGEIKGQLTITFQHDHPDIRRIVPEFG